MNAGLPPAAGPDRPRRLHWGGSRGDRSEQAEQAGDLEVTLTYYLLVGLTAVVAGLFVAIIVMLYNAVQTVISAVSSA